MTDDRDRSASTPSEARELSDITAWLSRKLEEVLEIDLEAEDLERPIQTFGLSSREELTLVGDLEDWLGYDLAPTVIWDHPTLESLARHIQALRNQAP